MWRNWIPLLGDIGHRGLVVLQKAKYRITTEPSKSPPRCLPQETVNTLSNRCSYANVHFGVLHDSQKVTQTKCPLRGKWVINTIHTYRAVLLNLKKKRRTDACSNVDDPQEHDAKGKGQSPHVLYSIGRKSRDQSTPQRRKVDA